jgi:hypothetical protein
MAKSYERIAARKLRREGKSIKSIAVALRVSKGSVSLWSRDIKLSVVQIERLKENQIKGGYKGRMIGAEMNRKKREEKIVNYRSLGRNETRDISKRELKLLGLGLYIGEGRKHPSRFGFTNSNAQVVQIILMWLQRIFKVSIGQISCRVYINQDHAARIKEVEKEWSKITNVPLSQFRRSVLIQVKNKKTYENHDIYLGNLAVEVSKSSNLQYKILGLIDGLVYNLKVQMPA